MDKRNRELELIVENFRELGIERVGPTHCTGYKAQEIFEKAYKENFIEIAAGKAFEI
jgi:7,8-dihydropterin-6-yl-methyl-4-(beta-D-ribofuranosyl)aminobenzene 5'-phosphate synthase